MKTRVFSPNHSHVALVPLRQAVDRARAPILSLPIIALAILLMAWTSSGQYVVFSDNFAGDTYFSNTSTLNSTTPGFAASLNTNNFDPNVSEETNIISEDNFFTDTSYTTSYEIISSGAWSPVPSISGGNLDFGLAASSFAQNIQVQALFADDVNDGPVLLGTTNDYIQLAVTFTDKTGILTNSAGGGGYFFMGLFNSNSNLPVAGGTSNAVSTSGTHTSGGAQNWIGYSAQISNTGAKNRVNTRVPQTGTGDNNQDALCGNSLNSTDGYGNPGPNISFSSTNSTVVLTAGSQYTAVLTLTATAEWPDDGTTNETGTNGGYACAISNSISLYAGANTSGSLLAQYGTNLTGANYTTNQFDALAIGWLENNHNVASEIDISQITVTASRQSDIANAAPSGVAEIDTNAVLGTSNAVFIAEDDSNIVVEDITDATGTNMVEVTVAGNGTAGYSGDGGPATSASLNAPGGVDVDASGNIYIADTGNNVVRKVTTNGIISTVVGNGTAGYSGDGGAATNATLNAPSGVAVDAYGDLYIADASNNVVRGVTSSGMIMTVAGNGTAGYSGDFGPATSACLNSPGDVNLDDGGNLYIADTANNVVRCVDTNGVITTVGEATNLDDPIPTSPFNSHTMIATATNLDGRLDIFAVGGDGLLYHKFQTNANTGPWSPWISLDSANTFSIYASPAATCDSSGHLVLFIVGNDSQMYRYKETTAASDASWSGSYGLGGNFSPFARVAAAANANGAVQAFAVSQTNNQLQVIYQATAGGSWSSWTNLGGTWDPQSDVAVGQNPDGSLSLLMIGVGNSSDTNALFEKRQQGPNGAWTSWTSRGGTFSYVSYIGLAINAKTNLEVFIVNNDPNSTQELMHCWKTNSAAGWMTNWVNLGTNTWRTTYQVPVAIRNQNGQLGVFMVGFDNDMHYNYDDPLHGWFGWTTSTTGLGDIGGPSGTYFRQGIGISAVMNQNGDFDIFGVGDDGNLYRATQDGPSGGFSTGWMDFGAMWGFQ